MLQYINKRSNNETSGYTLSTTVLKALGLLEYIAAEQPVGAPEICRGLSMTRANVHRLLATLAAAGYVEKREKGYELTLKLYQLGNTVPLNRDLRDVAKPIMIKMEKVAHENVYLNVLTDDVVFAIDEVKSPHHVVLNPDVTFSYPVNSCASGKVLLSMFDEKTLREFFGTYEMVKQTEYTIIDEDEFIAEVARVRESGVAYEILEFSSDLNSMAAPIYDQKGRVIATISLSGPAMRLKKERLEELEDELKKHAQWISEKLADNTRHFFTEKNAMTV